MLQAGYQKQDKNPKNDDNKIQGSRTEKWVAKWDKNFINALDEMTRSGSTQYTEAYRLTGTNANSFSKLILEIKNS